MDQAFKLKATFSQGEVSQALLVDSAGVFYLINPRVGGVLLKISESKAEALLASPKTLGLRQYKASAERTLKEVQDFLGPADNTLPTNLGL